MVIDDKLPTINGRLIFVHSKNQNEFWPALLEKAYAKYAILILDIMRVEGVISLNIKKLYYPVRVCGSYSDMIAGTPSEAMMDFTGGVHINIELSQPSPSLWGLICRAGKSNTLMGCGTPPRVSRTTPHRSTSIGLMSLILLLPYTHSYRTCFYTFILISLNTYKVL